MSDWWNDSGTTPTNPNWWMQTGTPTWGGRTAYRSGGGGPTPRFTPKATGSTGTKSTGGGGPTPRYVPQTQGQNTAWQIPRGEMDQLLKQYASEVGSVVPDMGGMTYDDIVMALGLTGGAPTTGGGGSGVRRAAAVPRWSQADVDALVAGGQQTAANVSGAWDAARNQLQQLMAQYAAADAARRAGAAQTLGAFGAPTQLDVGGFGAGDVLSALMGQAAINKAAEQANLEAMINNYKTLVGQVK